MQKIINFRTIFFIFLISLACIFVGFKANLNLLYLLLLLIPLLFLILLIIKKKYISFCASLFLFIFLITYTFLYVKNFDDYSFNDKVFTISARIRDIKKYSESNSYKLNLSHLSFIDEYENIFYPNFNMTTYLYGNVDNLEEGNIIVFNSEISTINLITEDESINTYYAKNNIKYKTSKSLSANNITLFLGNKTLSETLKNYNKNLLINSLGEDKGNLAFALIFGNRSEVNEDYMILFKSSGVVHIFAVSGLHVSIIVGLIYYLLKKLRLNNKVIFSVTFILLLIFCYLCSFSSSVVRATIMSLTLLFANIVLRKNDILTSISFAGLIILTLFPINLFDAGFQMSFVAVFGIIILAEKFSKIRIKNKFLKKAFLLVSVSVSTQIALLPLLAKYYGLYSTWSILANLFTLPLFSIFYPIFFIINLLCLPLSFLQFLYFLPNALLSCIIYINTLICYLPFSTFPIFYCGLPITILYYSFLFFISKYVFIKKEKKKILSTIFFTIVFSLFSINTLPKTSYENIMYFSSYSNREYYSSILSTKNDEFYLINPKITNKSLNQIDKELVKLHIGKVTGIIFTSKQNFQAKNFCDFLDYYNPIIYLPSGHDAINNLLSMNYKVVVIDENPISIGEILTIKPIFIDNTFIGTIFNISDFNYFELSYKIESNEKFIALEEYIDQNFKTAFDLIYVKYNTKEDEYYKYILKSKNYYIGEVPLKLKI